MNDFSVIKNKAIDLCIKTDRKINVNMHQFEIYGITFYEDLKIRNSRGKWFEVESLDKLWDIVQILV